MATKVTQVQLCISTCAITVFLGFWFSTELETIRQKLDPCCASNGPSLPTVHVSQNSSFSVSPLRAVNSLLHTLLHLLPPFQLLAVGFLPPSLLWSPSYSQVMNLSCFIGWSLNFLGIPNTSLSLKIVDTSTIPWVYNPIFPVSQVYVIGKWS